jgi:hypothetical protein
MQNKMVKVKRGQSIWDISVQETGTIANAVAISLANGISVTDDLMPGMNIIIPEGLIVNKKVKDYYTKKNITPATK